jgi:hypothetical protein
MTSYFVVMLVSQEPPDGHKPVMRALGTFGKLTEAKRAYQDPPE